jgi:hypothetical protein
MRMKLPSELVKLPLTFDSEQLVKEISQFSPSDWTSNPSGVAGNSALILVSVKGEINDEFAIAGQMQPTEFLLRCPYLQQVFQAIAAPISRSRLMRIAPGAKIGNHLDARYHWYRRIRIHIPVVTHPAIKFHCNGKSVHMGVGEAWTFDGSLPHGVANPTEQERIHLVIDTKGSETLNQMLQPICEFSPGYTPYMPDKKATIPLEPYSFEVLTTQEIESMLESICQEAQNLMSKHHWENILSSSEEFSRKWELAFSQYGHNQAGQSTYQQLLKWFKEQIKSGLDNLVHEHSSISYYLRVIDGMLTLSNRESY